MPVINEREELLRSLRQNQAEKERMERKEYEAKLERHRRQLFSMLSNGKEFLNLCDIQYQGGTGVF